MTQLTEVQEAWLAKHFKHTKNEEIAERLGVSLRTVSRLARSRGLNKSRQYIAKRNRAMCEAARRSHILNGTYPPKGYAVPGREKTQYKLGEPRKKLSPKREAERVRKSVESRKETFKLERARVTFGLPQETKLKVKRQPTAKIKLRYYLKKCGYIVDDDARIVYYTNDTKRGKKIESKKQPWYKFQELWQTDTHTQLSKEKA